MTTSQQPIAIYCHRSIAGYAFEPDILSGIGIAAGWIPLRPSLKDGETVEFDQTGHASWLRLIGDREGIDKDLASGRPRWRVNRLTDAEIELEYNAPPRHGILSVASRFLTEQSRRRAYETPLIRNPAVDVFQAGRLIGHIESPAFPGFGEIIGIWLSVRNNRTYDPHLSSLRVDQFAFERREKSLPRSNNPALCFGTFRAVDSDEVQFRVESFEHGIITLEEDDS